ncbi:hypothetical protein [Nannocystis pusilla]|uniref:hypothetical protein n=1 Tax=Nannocystis pusilla TaxID=889268 RepID=UPI003DA2EBCD
MSRKFILWFAILFIAALAGAVALLTHCGATDKAWTATMPTIACAFTITASFLTFSATAKSNKFATLLPAATSVTAAIASYYRLLERFMTQGELPEKKEILLVEEACRNAESSVWILSKELSDHFYQTWQALVETLESGHECVRHAQNSVEGKELVRCCWESKVRDLGGRLAALQAALRILKP